MNLRKYIVRFLFLISTFYALCGFSQQSVLDSTLIRFVDNNSTDSLEFFIKQKGVDHPILDSNHTLLTISIVRDNISVVKFLMQRGADINLSINNMTPLMHCAVNDRSEIASLLLKNGANVDQYNSHKNTAILYASRYGNLNTIKVLSQYRANPFFRNFVGYNSLDYAEEFLKTEAVDFLRSYMARFAKGAFPSTFDGPHIEWSGINRLRAFYMVNDSLNARLTTYKKSFRIRDSINFKSFYSEDTLHYTIYKPIKQVNQDKFTNVEKVFAVGDLHGQYDSLLTLLLNNKVIDKDYNWNFGSGHLVFIGDLFDRGDKVTELLWFVYKLWHQAPKSGGNVHVLIGNHEILILNKDYRYVNEKYTFLTRGLDIDFSYLYSNNTVLGNFLRSFKVAVTINDILFVHAGLSIFMVEQNVSIRELNQFFNQIFNQTSKDFIPERAFTVYSDAVSDKGPFWYRGYITESNLVPKARQDEVERVLNFFNAKVMVIGHTEVLSIETLYNGKVIPINVPFHRVGIVKQGLLYQKEKIYKCNSDGTVQLLM